MVNYDLNLLCKLGRLRDGLLHHQLRHQSRVRHLAPHLERAVSGVGQQQFCPAAVSVKSGVSITFNPDHLYSSKGVITTFRRWSML